MKSKRNARIDKCGKKPPLAPVNHFDKFHHTLEEVPKYSNDTQLL